MNCKINGCEVKGRFTNGYCDKHYSRIRRHGDASIVKNNVKHGNYNHPLYTTYSNMLSRCNNVNRKDYIHYGGKGISVCDRWLGENGFNNFCQDMGDKPSEKDSIDRIDSNGDYCPSNCKWSNSYQQTANRSVVKNLGVVKNGNNWMARIKINGKAICLGTYVDINDAIKARKEGEIKYGISI
jgi:hypothetical protein